MAMGTAKCTCTKCGNKFDKFAKKKNGRELASWIEWAENHYGFTCPECYGKEMNKKRKENEKKAIDEAEEIKEMHYGEYKKNYAGYRTVSNSYNSDTKTIKVIIPKNLEESEVC